MNSKGFSDVAATLIDGFDTSAHHAIEMWRDGGERLGQAARQRWDAAFRQSSPQLSAETRKNAQHARQVFGGYYSKAVGLSTSGATVAVDTLVQAARVAVQRTSTWQRSRA